MAFLIAFFITWAVRRIELNTNNFENRYPILLIDCQRNVRLNCSFENKVHNLANLIYFTIFFQILIFFWKEHQELTCL